MTTPTAPQPPPTAPKSVPKTVAWVVIGILALFIIIGIANSGNSSTSTDTASVPQQQVQEPAAPAAPVGPVTTFSDGTYVVGTDIVAGTYKTAPSGECYWARIRGTSDESDIIANHLASGPTTVTISSSDGAFVSRSCGQWMKTSASLTSTGPVSSFDDGTYVVGADIVAGTYKTAPSGECYWARIRGTSDESDIIANHLASGPTTVTISSSDGAFVSRSCGQWTKVG